MHDDAVEREVDAFEDEILDALLPGTPADLEQVQSEDWFPLKTEAEFDAALTKIAKAQGRIDRLTAAVEERVRLLHEGLAARVMDERGRIGFYQQRIRAGLERMEAVPKKVTRNGEKVFVDVREVKLATGKAELVPEERVEWTDDAATLAWAKKHPLEDGLYRVSEAPDKTAIRAHVKETGEAVPGMEVKNEPVFKVNGKRVG